MAHAQKVTCRRFTRPDCIDKCDRCLRVAVSGPFHELLLVVVLVVLMITSNSANKAVPQASPYHDHIAGG